MEVQDEILALVPLLKEFGPALGRPHVDTLKGSKHHNLKELRFDIDDGVWRLALAFDPERKAVLLVAGDKSGQSGRKFYRALIAKADKRYDSHLASLKRSSKERSVARNLDDILQSLPAARQRKIAARRKKLRLEYETLQELRKALNITQEQLARDLGVKQENVSRLESRQDMLLSTLARTINALGGRLDVVVRFAGNPPVSLSKLVEAAGQTAPAGRGESHSGRLRSARKSAAVQS